MTKTERFLRRSASMPRPIPTRQTHSPLGCPRGVPMYPILWESTQDRCVNLDNRDERLSTKWGAKPYDFEFKLIPTIKRDAPKIPKTRGLQKILGKTGDTFPSDKTVMFVGYAYWDMNGYLHTDKELDLSMQYAAHSKFPVSRPATYDEYNCETIAGLPTKNETGLEITFIGPDSNARGRGSLDHRNTLLQRKRAVLPKDRLDGSCSVGCIKGTKAIVCVYDIDRIKKQPSLTQFGYARMATDHKGKVLPQDRLAQTMPCNIPWTKPRSRPTEALGGGAHRVTVVN